MVTVSSDVLANNRFSTPTNKMEPKKKIYPEPEKAGQDESSLEKGLQDLAVADPESPSLSLHPLPSEDALIVKIQPPRKPVGSPTGLRRTPCDIVLVIDVSGSMNVAAPAPAAKTEANEDTGLSVLDLTKHAARTILATLGADDRLGIVTFSREATVVQALLPMDDEAKIEAGILIDMLQAWGPTNLWHGILEGVQLFRTADTAEDGDRAEITRNPAIMVLTDGAPNHMCPAQGYVAKLSTMLPTLPAPIHTFGFGYSIRSGLLKSIAETTDGNYAFIPDAGMIGTVFVHAVANMQAAYAHSARLIIKHPEAVIIEETTGATVWKDSAPDDGATSKEHAITSISLGSILYGQSRDLYLRLRPRDAAVKLQDIEKLYANAELVYSPMAGTSRSTTAIADLSYPGYPLPEADIAYHQSRSQLCNFISSLFTFDTLGERKRVDTISDDHLESLRRLIAELPAARFDDDDNKSLLEDLSGEAPRGQVSLAISKQEYWTQWGGHYLLSLLNAHTRQYCNSFKDPGPLRYGSGSPLFLQCKDALDTAFDTIPPPKPSLAYRSGGAHGKISMARYHRSSNPCFAGSAPVTLACGRIVPVRALRRGSEVQTPLGPRKVAAVLVTPVAGEVLCRVGGLLVTPWHPVSFDGRSWAFPAQLATSAVRYTGCIYSLLLQPDRISTAHAVHVGGLWGVTLGHGVVAGSDARAHPFFGDFRAVAKSLRTIGMRRNGLIVGGGIRRDEKTGLISGFRRGSGRVPTSMADVKRVGQTAKMRG